MPLTAAQLGSAQSIIARLITAALFWMQAAQPGSNAIDSNNADLAGCNLAEFSAT